MDLCTFPDTHTARFRRWYPARAERLWIALVDEATEWFAVRPASIDLRERTGTFGRIEAPVWRARIIEADPPHSLAFDHPDEFKEGGRLRFDIEDQCTGCWFSMTQQFRIGATIAPTRKPGGDVPMPNVPFRPGFLAGFHLMFENLDLYLSGKPLPTSDQPWLDLLPIYRRHILECRVFQSAAAGTDHGAA